MHKGLRKGDALLDVASNAQYYVMNSTLVDGCISLLDRETHEQKFWPLSEVYERIAKQSIKVLCQDAPKVPLHEQQSPRLLARLKCASQAVRKVLETATELGVSFDKAFRIVRSEHKGEQFPTRSCIYRYRERFLSGLPVFRGDQNKGRKSYYSAEVKSLIDEHAEILCSPDSRWRMPEFVRRINDVAKTKGYILPTQSISQRYVSKTLRELGYVDIGRYRMPRKDVAAARSIGARRIQTSYPLERVEIDGLNLPFVVQTEHGISSFVWCVHAIDIHTGMVLGWKIVVGGPSEDDGLDCIRSMLFPKKEAFQRLGLGYDFDVFGTPSLVVFDNGAENKGARLEKLLTLGIDTEHCAARHPHQKPHIERLNRSLKDSLEPLPGCTRKDGVDGKRDPIKEGDKLMSLHELEQFVVRWYYEQWSTTPLERHMFTAPECGVTAQARWHYYTKESGYVMPLPVTEDAWRKVTFVRDERKLSSKTGITHEGLNYKGSNLPYLVQHFYGTRLTIYSDPRDYRFIYVDDGNQLVPLIEEFVRPDTPAYTLAQEKERRSALKKQSQRTEATQFQRDIWERALEPRAPKPRRKSTERNRATSEKHQHSQAVQRAIDKPVATDIMSEFVTQLSSLPTDFLNLPTLDVLDRTSGEEKA
ncbi:DDE-type integrase/transposase/recombinase [Comamonas kerstersii]|uniref:DDE-type integrase/transposase/recombinase n=1 Tax=Comamonas kerstersii TaxID=225992 RepID=UPI0009841ECA|nr:DDE-type integrase/transposase/recombinase [Comamonas kerstersii]OOH84713.1 hypothetical protein BMF38_15545 [Comamonas kerstersii]OOH90741.1 hypothetical protein BMF29_12340 [Comamonas kerstersii]